LEQLYLDVYLPEFNVCPLAGTTKGRKTSEETRRKQSLVRKGVQHSSRHREMLSSLNKGRSKPVVAVPVTTPWVFRWFPSLSEAARQVGGSVGNIWQVLNGTYKSAYGYYWNYAKALNI
jgi:hypothetical protein